LTTLMRGCHAATRIAEKRPAQPQPAGPVKHTSSVIDLLRSRTCHRQNASKKQHDPLALVAFRKNLDLPMSRSPPRKERGDRPDRSASASSIVKERTRFYTGSRGHTTTTGKHSTLSDRQPESTAFEGRFSAALSGICGGRSQST
jgi:hypothetical protein